MIIKIVNPIIPYSLEQTGKVDAFQSYLQSKVVGVRIGFSMDFSNSTLNIDTDADDMTLFAELGKCEEVHKQFTQEEYEDYILQELEG
jgi:hypothetical protein